MILAVRALFFLSLVVLTYCEVSKDSCSSDPAVPVRVFVVPTSFSHGNDAGEIDDIKVSQTLDSVMELMTESESTRYRFNWADTAAFKNWFESLGGTKRAQMERLVRHKQFEFIGGGLVQQNGAASTLEDMVHQMSEGHAYLADHLRTRPRVAWQVDGGGLSGIMPYLLDSMGFSAVVLDLAKPEEVSKRSRARELEFVWRPDEDSGGTLAHVLTSGLSSPEALNFEKTGAEITKETVKELSEALAHEVRERVAHLRTRNVMIPVGGEHMFQNASKQFKNMDRLMAYVAAQPNIGLTMEYATISEYLETVRACAEDAEYWPEHYGGFVPPSGTQSASVTTPTYAAATSLRHASQSLRVWLRAADLLFMHSLEISAPLKGDPSSMIQTLLAARRELALSQHFRATSGKIRRHASASYVDKLKNHRDLCQTIAARCTRTIVSASSKIGAAAIVEHSMGSALQALNKGGEMILFVTNLLGWQQNSTFSVIVPEDLALGVTDEDGNAIVSQISTKDDGAMILSFHGQLPALGVRAFFVRNVMNSAVSLAIPSKPVSHVPTGPAASKLEVVLEGGRIRAIFSDLTGVLLALEDIEKGTRVAVNHQVLVHERGADAKRGTSDLLIGGNVAIRVEHGTIISELTHISKDPNDFGSSSQIKVIYRVFSAAPDDILGTVLSVRVSAQGVPPNTIVVSKISTELTDNGGTILYDDGELGFRELSSGSKREFNFSPMSSTAILQGKGGESVALMSPVVAGVYSSDRKSVQVALYERPAGGDLADHGAEFDTTLWLSLTHKQPSSHLQLAKMLRHPHVMSFGPAPARKVWRESFRGIYEPLRANMALQDDGGTGLIDPRIHVLTARVRDASLDSAVIRFVNTAESHASVKMDLGSFFGGLQLHQWKAQSLALSYTNKSNDEVNPDFEMWGLKHVVIPGRSVQTLTALFESAQPFDHSDYVEIEPRVKRDRNVPRDIDGNVKKDNKPNPNADHAWLQSQSLAGVDRAEHLEPNVAES